MVALSRMFWPPFAELAGRSGFMLEFDLLTRPTNLCFDGFSVPILIVDYAGGGTTKTIAVAQRAAPSVVQKQVGEAPARGQIQ